jgi:hypothetical protein
LIYKNNGDGSFTALEDDSFRYDPSVSMGFAYADFNRDGWLDFVQGNWNRGYELYQNQALAADHNWLSISLKGSKGVNRDAVGTRAYVRLADGREQMQEVISGQALGAGHDLTLHFGAGSSRIEGVTIVWPNGVRQVFEDVPMNQLWEVTYADP